MSKFYVGQRVKDCIIRPGLIGVVSDIIGNRHYPVLVRWPDGEEKSYTTDGRLYVTCHPTLVDADDEWYIVHKPAVKFEKWERVLVRDNKDLQWHARVFKEKTVFGTYLDADGLPWVYCRKWDESLVGKVTEE